MQPGVKYEYLSTEKELGQFCEQIADESLIAFDTEFVSEDRYRPDLCLVQVAAGRELAVIDPKSTGNLEVFWQLLASPGHTAVVHAGREEFRFCRFAIGQRPADWFDTQIAAALVGLDYPAAYGTLIQKLLGKSLGKGETRTNWRRRPLSKKQLEYALQDVVYLEPLYREISAQLSELERSLWLDAELTAWQDQLEAEENSSRWRRVSGISGLSPRGLAIVRELWQWRDQEASERDIPPRRVLRDDLLVEMARRQSAEPKSIRAVRDMDRRGLQRHIPAISACIQRALELPKSQCPEPSRRSTRPTFNLLGQFLSTAVNSMARSARVAPSLVCTVQDVRDLIAHHLGYWDADQPPLLATGWRSEVVGHAIDELLDGELAIRITNPASEQPLSFEPCRAPNDRADAS
jgi:ribonuclease D